VAWVSTGWLRRSSDGPGGPPGWQVTAAVGGAEFKQWASLLRLHGKDLRHIISAFALLLCRGPPREYISPTKTHCKLALLGEPPPTDTHCHLALPVPAY
jgi:hypothetical protein